MESKITKILNELENLKFIFGKYQEKHTDKKSEGYIFYEGSLNGVSGSIDIIQDILEES